MIDFESLLKSMQDQGASDLFLTTGAAPSVKVDGAVQALNVPPFAVGEVRDIAYSLMSQVQRAQFEANKESNFSWTRPGQGRFRVNVYRQRGEVAMVLRRIDSQVPSIEALELPSTVARLAMCKQGLVLIVGAAGSGKSTTLAAMTRYRAHHATGHILTIEDPIEFLFSHDKSMVDQREVGVDTDTFSQALHNALRESPDVIVIGEIRDRETAQHALAYAETGHLCISTLHANNANQAIERMVSFFPEDAHAQILQDLSLNLQAVISQRLVPAIGRKRIPAVEILLHTAYIADLIQRGKISEIKDEMAKGNEGGMLTFDQSLFGLYERGLITAEQATVNADSPTNMAVKMRLSVRHSPDDALPMTIQSVGED